MLIETEITFENDAGVETTYTLKGKCHPAEPDVGIMSSYCDEFWLSLGGKELELTLTEAQVERCIQALVDAYTDRNCPF